MVKPNKMKTKLASLAGWVRDSVAVASMMVNAFTPRLQPSRNLRRSFTRILKLHFEKGKKMMKEILETDGVMCEVLGAAVTQLTAIQVICDKWDVDGDIAPGLCPANRRAVNDFAKFTRNAVNSYIGAADVRNNPVAELDEFVRFCGVSIKALRKILRAAEQ